jgi:hypothetical protein
VLECLKISGKCYTYDYSFTIAKGFKSEPAKLKGYIPGAEGKGSQMITYRLFQAQDNMSSEDREDKVGGKGGSGGRGEK